MEPRQITPRDFEYWAEQNPREAMFTAPAEREAGIEPCSGLITDGDQFGPVMRVPWTLSEQEISLLVGGGTIWLSTWGHLPVHMLEVQPP